MFQGKVKGMMVAVIAVTVALLALAGAAEAAGVTGKISAIDLGASTITIEKRPGRVVTVTVTAQTSLRRNGQAATLAELVTRDTARAEYDPATLEASRVRAAGARVRSVSGVVRGARKQTGVVTIGRETVRTDANTKVIRNGVAGSLSTLTRRDRVVAHVQGTKAVDLLVEGPEQSEIKGAISEVNGDAVTIAGANATVTVSVTASTMIEVNGHRGAIGDLVPGLLVEAYYHPTTLVAFSIEAEDETEDAEVDGTVAAVDAAAGTLTIAPTAGGESITLTVNAGTEIEVNGETALLEAVQVGMPVAAEYDVTTLLAKEIEAGVDDDGPDDDGIDAEDDDDVDD